MRLPEELEGDVSFPWEARRLRIEDYRVIYALSTGWKEIAVLAVEKRPPYAYEDLDRLLEDLLG